MSAERPAAWEYGIAVGESNELHRSNMTEDEAVKWMSEWVQMSGRRTPFRIVRREVGEWKEPVYATA